MAGGSKESNNRQGDAWQGDISVQGTISVQGDGKEPSCAHRVQRNPKSWIAVLVLGVISWMFSTAGTFHCSFIMVETHEPPQATMSPTSNTSFSGHGAVSHPVGLGLFSTSVYDLDANLLGCVSYYGTSDEFDGAFRAARTFGLLGFLCTSIAVICVVLVTVFVESKKHKRRLWSVARFLFFASFLCELLTFLAFGRALCGRDDVDCGAGSASIVTSLNLFLLLGQSALIYIVPPVKAPLLALRRRLRRPMRGRDEGSAKFEVLPTNDAPSERRQIGADDTGGMDLESVSGSQAQGVIMMEGIECVAADHQQRRKKQETKWQKLVRKYNAFGAKRSVRITLGIFLCISWIFTIIGTTTCTFILVGAQGQDRNEFAGLGLFNRAYYMNDDILGCIAYPKAGKHDFDVAFEVGRAFGALTFLLVTASFASFVTMHGFLDYSRNKQVAWWGVTQMTLPCAFISQMVTFAAFETESCRMNNNVDCVPGIAAIFAILNVLILLPLSIFMFALPCPQSSFFRLRSGPPSLHGPVASIKTQIQRLREGQRQMKSQVQQLRQIQKQQQQQQQQQTGEEVSLPEATSTHSVSENSMYVQDPMGSSVVDESVEVCNTTVQLDENEGTRTIVKEVRHPDGSITVTTTVEEYAPRSNSVVASNSSQGLGMEATSTSSSMPTSSSGGPTTRITQGSSWDSGVSVEQFETVAIDGDGSNVSPAPTNIIERNVRAVTSVRKKKAKVVSTPEQQAIRDSSKCCMVPSAAMSIMKEMQSAERRKRASNQSQKSDSSSDETSSGPPSAIYPSDDPSQLDPSTLNTNTATSTSTGTSTSSTSNPSSSSSSSKSVMTPRGGHLHPGTCTSADAVGNTSISGTTLTDTCDDGVTIRTGDAVVGDDKTEAPVAPRRKTRIMRV